MKTIGAAVLAAALLCSACSGDSTTTPASVTPTSPVTETFTSILAPLGSTSHAFTTTQTAAISVTLTAAGPPIVVGLGLGTPIPAASGGFGCALTRLLSTSAASAPQIVETADAGDYCVAVLDVGNAPTTGVSFTVTIVHQ